VTGTWANCAGATKVEFSIVEVTARRPRKTRVAAAPQAFAGNIGANGTQATTFGGLTSGSTYAVTITVFDANNNPIATGTSYDVVAP
jgi:hypothetical protein